jgi:hypothetical protein
MDKRIVEEFPDKQFIRDVYEHLAYFYQIALGDGRGHTILSGHSLLWRCRTTGVGR